MDAQHLIDVRKRLGFTQAAMALELGMSRRGVMDLENGVAQIREIHRLAIEYLSLKEAIKQGNINLAEPSSRMAALQYGALFAGQDPAAVMAQARRDMLARSEDQREADMKGIRDKM